MNNYSLDSVVREYLIEKGDNSMSTYAQCLSFSVSCIREMAMDVNGVDKYVSLTINDNGTVDLPCDYMDIISIGIDMNGSICKLTSAKNINPILPYDDCGNETSKAIEGVDRLYDMNYPDLHTRNGENKGGYFGNGGGNNPFGNYIIDTGNQRILLSLQTGASSVILHYLCDPALIDGTYNVHSYDVEAVKSWIWWKDIQKKRNVSMSEKEMARVEWKRAKMMAKRRHKSFTLEDAASVLRKYQQQSPRM